MAVYMAWGWSLMALVMLPGMWIGAEGLEAADSTAHHVATGRQLLQRGAFAEAVLHLQQAADSAASAGKPRSQRVIFTLLAQAHQALGQYQRALHDLNAALSLA